MGLFCLATFRLIVWEWEAEVLEESLKEGKVCHHLALPRPRGICAQYMQKSVHMLL